MALRTLVLSLCLAAPAVATDYYVDPIMGNDLLGTGAPASPLATITKALTVAVADGDTVYLTPGTYAPSGGEAFPLKPKPGVTLQGSGVHQCVISGEGSGTLIETKDRTLISDVHLERAEVAIYSHMKPFDAHYLRRCRLENNDVGVRMDADLHSDGSVVLVGCSLLNNDKAFRHESFSDDFQSVSLLIYGTTVMNNIDAFVFNGFGERYIGVYDSIVWGNGDDSLSDYPFTLGVTSNLMTDPTHVGINGNLNLNPGLPSLIDLDAHVAATGSARDHSTIAPVWPPSGQWTGSFNWVWEATYEEIADLDGDLRPVGGPRDAGSDEFVSPTLHLNGPAELGATLELRLQADPGTLLFGVAGFGIYASPLGGILWLQPPYLNLGSTVAGTAGMAVIPVPVPVAPSLAGIDVDLQALAVGAVITGSLPATARLLP